MATKTQLRIAALAGIGIGMLLHAAAPAHGDKMGPPLCPAPTGTSPALFDIDGNGPDAGDLPAYITLNSVDATTAVYVVTTPYDACSTMTARTITLTRPAAGETYDRLTRRRDPYPPGIMDEAKIVDYVARGGAQVPRAGLLTEIDEEEFCVEGIDADGNPGVETIIATRGRGCVPARSGGPVGGGVVVWEFDFVGWDSALNRGGGDGVIDYVSMPWTGALPAPSCDGVTSSTTLWVPVEPDASGAVQVVPDWDCDGVADDGFPPMPLVGPATVVPVELQSFTVAALENPGGIGLSVLAAGGLFFGLGRIRRRLPDLR